MDTLPLARGWRYARRIKWGARGMTSEHISALYIAVVIQPMLTRKTTDSVSLSRFRRGSGTYRKARVLLGVSVPQIGFDSEPPRC